MHQMVNLNLIDCTEEIIIFNNFFQNQIKVEKSHGTSSKGLPDEHHLEEYEMCCLER